MSRQFMIAILVNVVLIVLFGFFSWGEWMALNTSMLHVRSQWSPFWITVVGSTGQFINVMMIPNYPFILFCVSTLVNIYFLIKAQKSKETRPA